MLPIGVFMLALFHIEKVQRRAGSAKKIKRGQTVMFSLSPKAPQLVAYANVRFSTLFTQ